MIAPNFMRHKVTTNIVVILFLMCSISCSTPETSDENYKADEAKVSRQEDKIKKVLFSVEGEGHYLYDNPGGSGNKIVNQKATQALGKTHYITIDYSVKFKIVDTSENWSKIKVVTPAYLSSSHIGWIESKLVIGQSEEKPVEYLDEGSYEILKSERLKRVHNYTVLIKQKEFNEDVVFDFIKRFRNQHCTSSCNIKVIDDTSILNLLDKYPLTNSEYIKVADHLISISTFDSPNLKDWYPFQDFQYSKYGGTNWKKTPIK